MGRCKARHWHCIVADTLPQQSSDTEHTRATNGPACSGCCRPLVIHHPFLGFRTKVDTVVRILVRRPVPLDNPHRGHPGTRHLDTPDPALAEQEYSVRTFVVLGTAGDRHTVPEHPAYTRPPGPRLEVDRKVLVRQRSHLLYIVVGWRPSGRLEPKPLHVELPHVQPAFPRYHPALRLHFGIESECRNRQAVLTLAHHRFAGRFPDFLQQHYQHLGWVLPQ